MANLTLYDITEDMLEIQNALLRLDGELTPEIEESLSRIQGEFLDKTDGYAHVSQNLSASILAKKKEIDRLNLRVKVEKNALEELHFRIKMAMEVMGRNIAKSERFEWKIVNNGGNRRIEITDLDKLPKEYLEEVVTVKANADKLREHFEGIEHSEDEAQDHVTIGIDGAVYHPRGTRLTLK